jgi:hypothetical protein
MSDSWDLPPTTNYVPIKSVPVKPITPVSNKPLIIKCSDCNELITDNIENAREWFIENKMTKLQLYNDHKSKQSHRSISDPKYIKKLSDDIAKIHCEEFKPLCKSCRDIEDDKLNNLFRRNDSDDYSE